MSRATELCAANWTELLTGRRCERFEHLPNPYQTIYLLAEAAFALYAREWRDRGGRITDWTAPFDAVREWKTRKSGTKPYSLSYFPEEEPWNVLFRRCMDLWKEAVSNNAT